MNIIVTGAASGIGCKLVTQLAERGHAVLATDVDLERLEQSAAEFNWPAARVTMIKHDVADADAWTAVMVQAAEKFDRLDVLVNVAGVLRVEAVHELKPQSVALQLDVNTKGVILGTSAAAAVMVRQRRGQIINVASMAALAPVPGIAVYTASKFAVRGFSLAAAQELEPHGVQVSIVYPDAVDTPMVDYQLDYAAAALTFSGSRILSAYEVASSIADLVEHPRLELMLPWDRGILAWLSNVLPRPVHRWISSTLSKKGLARQEAIRADRGEGKPRQPTAV